MAELSPGAMKLVSGFPVSLAAEHLAIVVELGSGYVSGIEREHHKKLGDRLMTYLLEITSVK